MTQRLCRVCHGWHDLDEPWPLECSSHFRLHDGRSPLAFPMVISDSMDAVRCMADGRFYESKAAMRATHKAHGLIEVGNDIPAALEMAAAKPARPKVDKAEVAAAINMVKNGYKPTIASPELPE